MEICSSRIAFKKINQIAVAKSDYWRYSTSLNFSTLIIIQFLWHLKMVNQNHKICKLITGVFLHGTTLIFFKVNKLFETSKVCQLLISSKFLNRVHLEFLPGTNAHITKTSFSYYCAGLPTSDLGFDSTISKQLMPAYSSYGLKKSNTSFM